MTVDLFHKVCKGQTLYVAQDEVCEVNVEECYTERSPVSHWPEGRSSSGKICMELREGYGSYGTVTTWLWHIL